MVRETMNPSMSNVIPIRAGIPRRSLGCADF